ncbi:MAG: DnaJ domain-containing protein [Cyanobacteria bacterium P01_H01_bin.35]
MEGHNTTVERSPPYANAETVKLAYRRLARQYHPDINRNKETVLKMQIINQAYSQFLHI